MQNDIRKPRRGRPINHPKVMIEQTGEIYDSYEDTAKAINGYRGNVLQCLRGLRKTCNGFTFCYIKE